MQSSEDNNASDPSTNNDLENRFNNDHRLSRRKFILLEAGLVSILVAGYAKYNLFTPNQQTPPKSPYDTVLNATNTPTPTPTPTSTPTPTPTTYTPAPTETPTSLEDKLPPDGPLSPEQISQYTLIAYEMAYNDGKFDSEKRELAKKCLGTVIDAVVDSIFKEKALGYEAPGFEEYVALERTWWEYTHWKLPIQKETDTYKEGIRPSYDRLIKKIKMMQKKDLKRTLGFHLGAKSGALA